MSVEPRSYGGAAQGQFKQVVKGKVEATQIGVQLGNPTGRFLAKGQWNCVHEVGSADLHDGFPLNRFGVECIPKGSDAGQQTVGERLSCSDVHGGGKGVVGRLSPIDVVVGVNGGF